MQRELLGSMEQPKETVCLRVRGRQLDSKWRPYPAGPGWRHDSIFIKKSLGLPCGKYFGISKQEGD